MIGKVNEGYKMTELGEIPVEWEISELKELFDINTKSIDPQSINENVFHFSLPAFDKDKEPILENSLSIKSNKTIIEQDCILVSKLNPRINRTWKIIVSEFEGLKVSSTEFINYLPKVKVNLNYFFYVFSSPFLQAELMLRESGTTGSRKRVIPVGTLDIKIPLPHIDEQQKIAEILSTVDEQLKNIVHLIEKTKELKKGLMQQLLTRGIGHAEFKQTELGEIPLDWHISELEEISNLITKGTSPSTYKFDFEDVGVNFIRSENILKSNKLDVSDLVKVSEECHNKLSRSQIETGDILISIAGMFLGKIGIVPKGIVPANTNQAVAIVRLKEKILNEYLYYYLQSTDIRNVIENIATAGAQPNLNLKQVGSFKIKLPPLEEQQKIAQILSTIDEQVEVYEQEKEKYEELKKGLMQQLLTGQIRVKV